MSEQVQRFVNFMNRNKNSLINQIKVAQYEDSYFICGNLKLDSEDVLVPDVLKNGYVRNVGFKDGNLTVEKEEPLKNGDTVLILRMSDELYCVLERMVEL